MNMVLAVAVLTGLYMVKYQKVSDADMEAVIGHVMPDSPAAKAGITDGDRIVKMDGKSQPHLGRRRPEGNGQRLPCPCTSPSSAMASASTPP